MRPESSVSYREDLLKRLCDPEEESSMSLPPIQVVMEEVTDPQEIAEAQAQMEQARRNSAWLQAHAHEIYTQRRGKFIVVAGEELFVGDTPEEANALAKAAHPEDKGRIGRYIYPKKMARVYGNQRRMAIL